MFLLIGHVNLNLTNISQTKYQNSVPAALYESIHWKSRKLCAQRRALFEYFLLERLENGYQFLLFRCHAALRLNATNDWQ